MGRKKTKTETISEVVELLEKIEAKETEVEAAKSGLEEQREGTKTAKGVWLTKINELQELIRTRKRWAEEAERQPLFNQLRPDATQLKADRPAAVVPQQIADQGDRQPHDWRRLGLKTLQVYDPKITDRHVEKLRNAGLSTLGILADRMDNLGTFWAKSFRWSGAIRQPIEDALGVIQTALKLLQTVDESEKPKVV